MKPLTNRNQVYWQKRGLLPSKQDLSYESRRFHKFIEQCLQLGFKPIRLLKIKQESEKKLHHLRIYRIDSKSLPLTADLVFQKDEKLWLSNGNQQMLNFSIEDFGKLNVIDANVELIEILNNSHDIDLQKQLTDFLKRQPLNVAAWVELGNLNFEANDYLAAVECYESGIELEPLNAELFFNIANCYVRMNQYAVAIQKYNQSLQIKPDFAEALYSLSMLYITLEKGSQAIQLLRWLAGLGDAQWSQLAIQFIEDIEQQELKL